MKGASGIAQFAAVRLRSAVLMNRASTWAGQAREIVLHGEIAEPRGVTLIDDLQDAIARHRPARAEIATRLAGSRVGAFWKPGDPAFISLPAAMMSVDRAIRSFGPSSAFIPPCRI